MDRFSFLRCTCIVRSMPSIVLKNRCPLSVILAWIINPLSHIPCPKLLSANKLNTDIEHVLTVWQAWWEYNQISPHVYVVSENPICIHVHVGACGYCNHCRPSYPWDGDVVDRLTKRVAGSFVTMTGGTGAIRADMDRLKIPRVYQLDRRRVVEQLSCPLSRLLKHAWPVGSNLNPWLSGKPSIS